jgi:hypothetical protein
MSPPKLALSVSSEAFDEGMKEVPRGELENWLFGHPQIYKVGFDREERHVVFFLEDECDLDAVSLLAAASDGLQLEREEKSLVWLGDEPRATRLVYALGFFGKAAVKCEYGVIIVGPSWVTRQKQAQGEVTGIVLRVQEDISMKKLYNAARRYNIQVSDLSD